MEEGDESVGFLEYHGKLVGHGVMDARKTARVLLGLDDAVRHFSSLQYPPLQQCEYELPVAVRPGSWQAWLMGSAVVVATAYAGAAAAKIAENDFKNVSMKKILRESLRSIQWLIRIGRHLGSLHQKHFENVRWRNGASRGQPSSD